MFVIQTSKGVVAAFNSRQQVVPCAGNLDYAKQFKTEKAARTYAAKYADCGYGLSSAGLLVVPAEKACFAPKFKAYYQAWDSSPRPAELEHATSRWGAEQLLGYFGTAEQAEEAILADVKARGLELAPESNMTADELHLWDREELGRR